MRLSASTGAAANQTTKYLWDRNFGLPQLAIERDGNNALLRSYRYGLDLLRETAGSTTYYYHPDGLGSAADVTSSTGTSLTWSEFYPYGLVRQAGVAGSGAPAVQPFGFTGEQRDGLTGLYYLRARQYDPGTGRFLTTDPVGAAVGEPLVGTYVYVRNNPGRWTDPNGACLPFCAIGAAIGAVVSTTAYVVTTVATGGDVDLGQAAVAFGTGAIAGAVCTATAGTTCLVGSVLASEAQYQLSPGDKDPVGYVLSGVAGVLGARFSYTPAAAFRRAGAPAVRLPLNINDLFDFARVFAGGAVRSSGVTIASDLVQIARGATGK